MTERRRGAAGARVRGDRPQALSPVGGPHIEQREGERHDAKQVRTQRGGAPMSARRRAAALVGGLTLAATGVLGAAPFASADSVPATWSGAAASVDRDAPQPANARGPAAGEVGPASLVCGSHVYDGKRYWGNCSGSSEVVRYYVGVPPNPWAEFRCVPARTATYLGPSWKVWGAFLHEKSC